MSHKADQSFFATKREWSRVKDAILSYYLVPYLQKVKDLRRPILLVDLFAGPGKFDDGSDGSPLILLRAAKLLADQGRPITTLLVEQDTVLAEKLRTNVASYGDLADVRTADCMTLIDDIADRAVVSTTFLYVDPFTISGLDLGRLARIFGALGAGASVELLFVFMAPIFLRWASACQADEGTDLFQDKLVICDDGTIDMVMAEAVGDRDAVRRVKRAMTSAAKLDAIAGGTYWRDYIGASREDRYQAFVDRYCEQLRSWFPTVCNCPVRAEGKTILPKYWILFGTRYRPAIDLVNRAIKSAMQDQEQRVNDSSLFANIDLPPKLPLSHLNERIVGVIKKSAPIHWEEVRWAVSESDLGAFTDAEINGQIKALLQSGAIIGARGDRTEPQALLSPP